ncbi:MAG: peptidylprolyl isomerase [Sedimentisphaerales bacterium]|nr:peptidylprolyl isomerase [Sedimentisphaerales bacterium]
MKKFWGFVLIFAIIICVHPACLQAKNPYVIIKTNLGYMVIELFPDQAPVTVDNFLYYVNSGFYTGLLFHRSIPGFVIQGGGYYYEDPNVYYWPPDHPNIINESYNGLSNLRGTVAMARNSAPDSANTQFYINQGDNTFLDRRNPVDPNDPDSYGYCVFGQVVDGMMTVDMINSVPTTTIYEAVYLKDVPFDLSLPGGFPFVWMYAYVLECWWPDCCNFVPDDKINFRDFAAFALHWLDNDCNSANGFCNQADLNYDNHCDIIDLAIFGESWLYDFSVVGYWPMEDNDSTTNVLENSGNEYHGAASQNTVNMSTMGIPNSAALAFNGTSDYVSIPKETNLLTGTNDFSVAGWMYFNAGTLAGTTFPPHNLLVWLNDIGGSVQFCIGAEGTFMNVWACGGTPSPLYVPYLFSEEQWYYLVFTRGGNTWKAYVNGSEVGSNTSSCSLGNPISDYYIGGAPELGQYFDGIIDEVVVYNVAISAQRVENMYTKFFLTHLWPFDEGTGTMASDQVGLADGTVSGTEWTAGKFDSALSFDGTDDYVVIPQASDLIVGTDDFTVAGWMYFDAGTLAGTTFPPHNLLAWLNDTGGSVQFCVGAEGTFMNVWACGGTPSPLYVPYLFSEQQWYHLAFTRQGDTWKAYVNGSEIGTTTSSCSLGNAVGDYYIGGVVPLGQYFDGKIDDVRIYNKALSESEISNLYYIGP